MKRRLSFWAGWYRVRGQIRFWECTVHRINSPPKDGWVCGNVLFPAPAVMKYMLEQNSAFVCEILIDRRAEDK